MDALERMQPKASTGMKPRVKPGGYSFIELLVAISLVSIISLVALPSFREAHSAVALDSLSSESSISVMPHAVGIERVA